MINAVKRAITNLSKQERDDFNEKRKQVECGSSVMIAVFKIHTTTQALIFGLAWSCGS